MINFMIGLLIGGIVVYIYHNKIKSALNTEITKLKQEIIDAAVKATTPNARKAK